MTRRPQADAGTDAPIEPEVVRPARPHRTTSPGTDRPSAAPLSKEEAEAEYIAARDAWIDAMHRASSGRSPELASLGIAQEAYEKASAQREGWVAAHARVAIPIRPAEPRRSVDVVVNQDLAWRRIRDVGDRRPNFVVRLMRRLTRRG